MRFLAGAPLFLLALLFACLCTARAEDGYWEPPGVHPSGATLAAILTRVAAATGTPDRAYAERSEHYAISGSGFDFEAVATIRGDDFAVASALDGETYSAGRSGGSHWRRTPRGLVHLIEADVQGDDLDRWPTAFLPLSPQCTLAGETMRGNAIAWVLLDRREHDIPHWFFVDALSGRIVGETTREGTRVETTSFDDFRETDGVTRPFHWHTDGPGGALDVKVMSVKLEAVDPRQVAIPGSASDTLPLPDRAETIPSRFGTERIAVPVKADGRTALLLLDTGTPNITVSEEFARRLGLRVALGHATLPELGIGAATARAVPVNVVSFPGDGILGYEFFSGRIVHLDFARELLQTLPRTDFTAPADAHELASDWDEGMPLVAMRAGRVTGERFVLDIGSFRLVVLAHLLRRGHYSVDELQGERIGQVRTERYLEGPIETQAFSLNDVSLGFGSYKVPYAEVQTATRNNDAEFPIDGIIGNDILHHFEWWFDADGGRTWFRFER